MARIVPLTADLRAFERVHPRGLALAGHRPGANLVLCGPAGFRQPAPAAAADWPDDAVHLGDFAPPVTTRGGADEAADEPFEAVLAHRGAPEHRDHCLSATERRSKVALCCTRGRGGVVTMDL